MFVSQGSDNNVLNSISRLAVYDFRLRLVTLNVTENIHFHSELSRGLLLSLSSILPSPSFLRLPPLFDLNRHAGRYYHNVNEFSLPAVAKVGSLLGCGFLNSNRYTKIAPVA